MGVQLPPAPENIKAPGIPGILAATRRAACVLTAPGWPLAGGTLGRGSNLHHRPYAAPRRPGSALTPTTTAVRASRAVPNARRVRQAKAPAGGGPSRTGKGLRSRSTQARRGSPNPPGASLNSGSSDPGSAAPAPPPLALGGAIPSPSPPAPLPLLPGGGFLPVEYNRLGPALLRVLRPVAARNAHSRPAAAPPFGNARHASLFNLAVPV